MSVVLALTLLLAGCSNGVLFNSGLYSHTVEPLTFNRNPTEVERRMLQANGDISHIQLWVAILWGTNRMAMLPGSMGSRPSIMPILKNCEYSSVYGRRM
jgi:hypothetical protein